MVKTRNNVGAYVILDPISCLIAIKQILIRKIDIRHWFHRQSRMKVS